jgi:transketolase
MDKNIEKLKTVAKDLRKIIIEASYETGTKGVHIGSSLSMVEILAVLYGKILKYDVNNPDWNDRDRLILSKGHGYIGLYSALNLFGFISSQELKENFMTNGGFLPVHPVKNIKKGIECSTGSLGMGLSFAVGKAYYANSVKSNYMTYTILGDGECNEGNIWEAVISAAHYKLSNLVAIIDRNRLQQDGLTKDIMYLDLENNFKSFGWEVVVVNGHNVGELYQALSLKNKTNSIKPLAIIADTIKGGGISFMENNNKWHHAHMSDKEYLEALNSLK